MTAACRCFPFVILLSLGGVFTGLLARATASPDDPARPNIVVIMADDLGWMDLHCYGNPSLDTPALDKLAAAGMRFTDAYAAAPVCSPTRAAMMTGQAPARIGLTNHAPGNPDGFSLPGSNLQEAESVRNLALSYVTLAERLADAGYATAHIGKWHLSYVAPGSSATTAEPDLRPDKQGFDINIGGCFRGGPPSYFSPYQIPTLKSERDGEYLPERLADEAIAFIREPRDAPFFLNWWPYSVHYPMQAREALIAKYRQRKGPGIPNPVYAAMIEAMDTEIGRFLEALNNAGLSDNTLVIFKSDNGGYDGDNRPLRGMKGMLYEGGIRIPWFVRWPGKIQPGTTCSTPVISTDCYPTLLEVAGLPPTGGQPVDGKSLLPLLLQTAGWERDKLCFHYPNYAFHKKNLLGGAIRSGDYKLIKRYGDGSLELYNLAEDLGETTNLAQESPDVAQHLEHQLNDWLVETGARMPIQRSDKPGWKLIMDNDGNEARTMTAMTREEFLAQRMGPLAESQLDGIFYCTNATFGLATRKSQAWQMRDYAASGQAGYDIGKLVAAGVDPLQVTVEFGKQHGISIFNTIRMNDIHDFNFRTPYGEKMFRHNQWKQAHADWLLGTQDHPSRTGAWSAANYAVPEVRQKMLDFVGEAITNYDLDGISLDFFRHPVFFRATLDGKTCSDQDRDMMTELMARIHDQVEAESKRRGRKLKLAIRVPDSVDYCHAIGLDLEHWLANQWIDMLVVSGYFRLNEWNASAELGERYQVEVLASLDESRVRDPEAQAARRSVAGYLGRAAAIHSAGLDGVVTFNLFDPNSMVFRQLGDPEKWPRLPKDFFASGRGVIHANGGNLPTAPFRKSETLNPGNPKSIPPGNAASARIVVGPSSGLTRRLWLRLDRPLAASALATMVNHQPVRMQSAGGNWLVSVDDFPPGDDTEWMIEARLDKDEKQVRWLDAVIRDQPAADSPNPK